jgi:hypothetical protein
MKVDRLLCGLVVRVPGCRSRGLRYQIFWEVVGLERGPPSFVSTIEELEIEITAVEDASRWPRGILYLQTLALTSLTIYCRSFGIVSSQTQATEFSFKFSSLREKHKLFASCVRPEPNCDYLWLQTRLLCVFWYAKVCCLCFWRPSRDHCSVLQPEHYSAICRDFNVSAVGCCSVLRQLRLCWAQLEGQH